MNMIPDIVWKEIENIIPRKKSKVRRPEMCPRQALNTILYVLRTGVQWHWLPKDMGKASTVHGKFRKWVKLGIFEQIMEKAAQVYECRQGKAGIWYAIDTSACKAPLANWSGANPTDRSKRVL